MKVMVTGANGFIGSHIVAALLAAGHEVVCCVRKVAATKQKFPNGDVLACDFNQDVEPEVWCSRLANVDAVVNCVGILQATRSNDIQATHTLAPCALFKACAQRGVKKVVHISALGAAEDATTEYGRSKFAADQCLFASEIEGVALRPSLVYSLGSYGGTSLFRGLAGLLAITPIVGDGHFPFQPIHVRDLARTIVCLLTTAKPIPKMLNVVGPETVSMQDLILRLRKWLGLGKALTLHIPLAIMRVVAKIGDVTSIGPINTTALNMLVATTTVDTEPFAKAIDFQPRSFSQALAEEPAQTQDLWHARLYFLQPLLRVVLALFWIVSGLVPIVIANSAHVQVLAPKSIIYLSSIWNIVLGCCLLINWRTQLIAVLQIVTIVIYTILATVMIPQLWLDPFGALVKNIPILIATLIMLAIAKER